MELCVTPSGPLRGEAQLPGDKSIAHRALIAAALAEGKSHILGFDPLDDGLRTLEALGACGVRIERPAPRELRVWGRGLRGLQPPPGVLDCGASGTTMRLLAGLLAGQPLSATLDGCDALRRRPMGRVTAPLARMGARVEGPDGGAHAPFTIHGGALRGIDYTLPVASAQVKSALLLAALNADGETVVREPAPTRDHTERLLAQLGLPVAVEAGTVRLRGGRPWPGIEFELPGDISAAAFLLAAASLVPGSELLLRDVGLNPTRTGCLDALRAMGGQIEIVAQRGERSIAPQTTDNGPRAIAEPCGDLLVRSAPLQSIELGGALIPNLIDELPVLAVVATQARGTTVVRDAAELRVKETDRIAALARELGAMGAAILPREDGFVIEGPTPLRGARVDAHGDHRTAMALAVAGLIARGETVIAGAESVSKSFPAFAATLRALGAPIREVKSDA
jgi:3-phosphoshikimate 1-carboxyvinyltransferase